MRALYYSEKWANADNYRHMLLVISEAVRANSIELPVRIYIPAQPEYLGVSYLDGRYISRNHLIYLYNNNIPNWRKMA